MPGNNSVVQQKSEHLLYILIRLAFLTLFAALVECFSLRYFFMHSLFYSEDIFPRSQDPNISPDRG